MRLDDRDAQWRELAEEAFTGVKEWRLPHPTATFREIEAAVDERLARVRARLLHDAALASAAADLRARPAAARPICPDCGHRLEARGQEPRQVTTTFDHPLSLTRTHAVCPACGTGLFSLDEELALLPGALTPGLQEGLVRLGAWLPCATAAAMLAYFTQVRPRRRASLGWRDGRPAAAAPAPVSAAPTGPRRPAANHPWRRGHRSRRPASLARQTTRAEL